MRRMGFDAARESLAVQARVGYMPQRFGLYEDLSVPADTSTCYADLQGVPHADRIARYDELMHMTGLARFTKRLAGAALRRDETETRVSQCTLVRPPERAAAR